MKVNLIGSINQNKYKSQNNVNFKMRLHPERVGDSIIRKNDLGIVAEEINFYKGTKNIKEYVQQKLKGLVLKRNETKFNKDGSKSKKRKTFVENSSFAIQKEKTLNHDANKNLSSKTIRKLGNDKNLGTYELIIQTEYYPDGKTVKEAQKTKRYLYRDIIEKATTKFNEKGTRIEQREIQGGQTSSYMILRTYDQDGKQTSNTPSYHIVDDGL